MAAEKSSYRSIDELLRDEYPYQEPLPPSLPRSKEEALPFDPLEVSTPSLRALPHTELHLLSERETSLSDLQRLEDAVMRGLESVWRIQNTELLQAPDWDVVFDADDPGLQQKISDVIRKIQQDPHREHLGRVQFALRTLVNSGAVPQKVLVLQDIRHDLVGEEGRVQSFVQHYQAGECEFHVHHEQLSNYTNALSVGDVLAMFDVPDWQESIFDAHGHERGKQSRPESKIFGVMSVVTQHNQVLYRLQLYLFDVKRGLDALKNGSSVDVKHVLFRLGSGVDLAAVSTSRFQWLFPLQK